MPSLDSPFGLFLMLDLILFPVGVLVLLLILGKARRLERALWAVVSQLRASRMAQHPDLDPAATRRALEVAERSGNVKMSMFGR
jgi:hypothetical protein